MKFYAAMRGGETGRVMGGVLEGQVFPLHWLPVQGGKGVWGWCGVCVC